VAKTLKVAANAVASTGITPLVLVVEDRSDARKLREQGLRAAGCHVMGAATLNEALTSLRDGPTVDLIVTDVHLGRNAEQGGVILAMTVKAGYDPDLPMAMYSAKYDVGEIDGDLGDLFVLQRTKGYVTSAEMTSFYAECRVIATQRRQHRMIRARQRGELFDGVVSRVSSKDLALKSTINDLEQAIVDLGFRLRLLSSDQFSVLAQTVAAWIRQLDGIYEAQVCGQPYLHWEAESEEEALSGLVSVMAGYAQDLASNEFELGPSISRLKAYLDSVIDKSAAVNDSL
jgi:CheY-like chemotaxis protein